MYTIEHREKSDAPDGQLDLPVDLYGRPASGRPQRHSASYLWLAYSVFFFIEPVIRNEAHYWLTQLPVYAVFLALYVTYVEVTRPRVRYAVIACLYVAGVLSMPFNLGGSCFFIYVASLLPFCLASMPIFFAVMVVELVTLGIESQLYPHNPINYLITGFFIVVVGIGNLFIANSKRADLKLRAAQEENVALAAVAERERIARDLHDVLGHTLSVIVLKSELAGRLIEQDPKRAATEMADVERTARTALAEVRETIGGYRTRGLNAEMEQARQTLSAAGVLLQCETRPPVLEAKQETVLALAVREAVTNIVRHAHATECTMRFATAPDGFASFEVADNGRPHTAAVAHEGNGLRGMRERVQQVGGRFRIESERGTRLLIELPRLHANVQARG